MWYTQTSLANWRLSVARKSISIVLILALLIGAVLILDGIGRLVQADSLLGRAGRAVGTQSSTINIIVAIIELAAGAIVILTRFTSFGKSDAFLGLLALIGWAAVIVLTLFVTGFAIETLSWWLALAQSGVILVALWLIRTDR